MSAPAEPTLVVGLALALAVLFAFVNGMNNGGGLVAVGAAAGLAPWQAVVMLGLGLAVAPLITGTRVAATLGVGLLGGPPARDALAVVLGVAVAMAATVALNRRGLPTSITLATVGGVAGAGLGGALPVHWVTVSVLAALALAAPLMVGVSSPLVMVCVDRAVSWPSLASSTASPLRRRRRLRVLSHAAFTLQAFAYGANDGQRMLAVLVAGLTLLDAGRRGSTPAVGVPVLALLAVATVFCFGALSGLRHIGIRLTRRLGGGMLGGTASELTAALSSLAAAHAGAPMSLSQATTAGLVGVQRGNGGGRVRWEEATRLLAAWLVTAPTSLAAAALVGFLCGHVSL